MSWYLFNNSPQRQYRGIKVDGYSNNNRPKLILDWGLGQLSPKKQQYSQNSQYVRQNLYESDNQKNNTIQNQEINNRNQNKQSRHKQKKIKAVKQAIRVLTTQTSGSQAQQQKQQLLKVLKDYTQNKKQNIQKIKNQIISTKNINKLKLKQSQNNKKKQQSFRQKVNDDKSQKYINVNANDIQIQNNNKKIRDNRLINKNNDRNNDKASNIFNNFQFNTEPIQHSTKNSKLLRSNHSRKVSNNDYYDHQKQMRYLQSTLLPLAQQDNVTAALDHQLNAKLNKQSNNVSTAGLSDSRISGKTHFGNKKNQSAVQIGHGFNVFKPLQHKVKDMNQKLKQMYQYDEWVKKRQSNNQFKFG